MLEFLSITFGYTGIVLAIVWLIVTTDWYDGDY